MNVPRSCPSQAAGSVSGPSLAIPPAAVFASVAERPYLWARRKSISAWLSTY